MNNPENPHAGQGPVLLDIGDDVGALIVTMPPGTEGLEVEIRPHDHAHQVGHDPADEHPHHPHVAVVARPGSTGPVNSLVYPHLSAGDYDLVPMPGDTVAMSASVRGGAITQITWPEQHAG